MVKTKIMFICVCVCVCKERERKREYDKKSTICYSGPRVSETSLYYCNSVILKIIETKS